MVWLVVVRAKFICFFSILFFIQLQSAASTLQCALTSRVEEAAKQNQLDDNFWKNYSRLNVETQDGRRSLAKLLDRYDKKSSAGLDRRQIPERRDLVSRPRVVNTNRRRPQLTHAAIKEVKNIPSDLRKPYADFLEEITSDPSGRGFYAAPSRWHFEKMPQYGKEARSIRLNKGYRVLFDMTDSGVVIRSISKSIGH